MVTADEYRRLAIVSFLGGTGEEGWANARLIAAAPVLLASCQELLEALAVAMRVIEAATGEKADIIDDFVDEMALAGVANGVGVRGKAAVKKATEDA